MRFPARFNGPPGSGNGGYCAGVMAGVMAGAVGGGRAGEAGSEVTLRRPPPLETPLTVAEGVVRAPDGSVVAELGPLHGIDVAVPRVGYDEAVAASRHYRGFIEHPFPTCYVCGPDHPDGLRIFPGPLPDGTTAAPWTVPADWSSATVWAALDCPGGWAVIAPNRPYVLGRLAVLIARMPAAGDRCVVRGELAGLEGRKALTYSTLYAADGTELARARATWIAVAR